MPNLVTGDAVVLDVQIAQLPVRVVSALIDILVVVVGYVLVLWQWLPQTQFDDALRTAVSIILAVLLQIGYPLVFETTTRGQSLGKMAMGLRVVSDDGGPERFRQALFRALAAMVEIWVLLGSPAVICSLLSSRGKRLGDIFAGTVVVSERAPAATAPPLMPPMLAWWAASLQLSGLRPETAEAARQFLSRTGQLDPRARAVIANQIAGELVSQIWPPPPPGVPAEVFLAAVLAERHRREVARLRSAPAADHPAPATPAPWPSAVPSPAVSPRPGTGGFVPPN